MLTARRVLARDGLRLPCPSLKHSILYVAAFAAAADSARCVMQRELGELLPRLGAADTWVLVQDCISAAAPSSAEAERAAPLALHALELVGGLKEKPPPWFIEKVIETEASRCTPARYRTAPQRSTHSSTRHLSPRQPAT